MDWGGLTFTLEDNVEKMHRPFVWSISIVIPTYNRVQTLMEGLHALREQTMRDFEVLVVDNGPSTDTTRESVEALTREDPRFVYIATTEVGAPRARTIGCLKALSSLVLTTDDDWEMTNPDSLQFILDEFKRKPSLGVLGIATCQENRYGFVSRRAKMHRLLYRFGLIRPGSITRWGRVDGRFHLLSGGVTMQVDHVRSCCMAFRKEPAQEAGLFPPLYSLSGYDFRTETELCRRIAGRGYTVEFTSQLKGSHKEAPRHFAAIPRSQTLNKVYHLSRNHSLFMLRNYWTRASALVFFAWDLFVGTCASQPGLFRLFISLRHLGQIKVVLASLRGKCRAYIDFHRTYHDLNVRN